MADTTATSAAASDPSVIGTSTDKVVHESRPDVPETKSTDTESKTFDADYVRELREEAARHRTEKKAEREQRESFEKKYADMAKKVEEFERAQLSEQERQQLEYKEAKSEADKLRSTLKESFLEAAVAKHSRKLADVDAALKLLDASTVEYDDNGRPSNIDSVLESTLERFPFLKAGSASSKAVDTGTTNPGKARKGGSLTREAVQNMSHSERVERMSEITAWAANGYR